MISGQFSCIYQMLKVVRWKNVKEKHHLLVENAKFTSVSIKIQIKVQAFWYFVRNNWKDKTSTELYFNIIFVRTINPEVLVKKSLFLSQHEKYSGKKIFFLNHENTVSNEMDKNYLGTGTKSDPKTLHE